MTATTASRPLLTSRDLGAAVAATRKARGWSQATLADRAGVTRPWLSSFENGKPTVSLDGALRVMIALGLGLGLLPADARLSTDPSFGGFDLNQYIDNWSTGHPTLGPSSDRHD